MSSAIVVCGHNDNLNREILGLTVGERLCLSLMHGGVTHVAFIGDGTRPRCKRAKLQEVPVEALPDDEVIVLPSDAVFDRGLLRSEVLPQGGPLLRRSRAAVTETIAESFGDGSAHRGQGFAIRVTDTKSARAAGRSLRLSLRKPIDGLVSRHLNRYLSTAISRLLVRTKLSPNIFTVVFMVIGIASGVCAAIAEPYWMLILAAVLFQAQSVLDGCDGEIARLRFQFSRVGQWLDSIGDDLTNYIFCFGLALGQARVLDSPTVLWLGVATLAAQVLASATLYRRMVIMKTGDLLAIPDLVTGEPGDGALDKFFGFLRLLAKRDTFVFIIAVLTAVQLPLVAFFVYAGGTFPMLFGVLVNEYRIVQRERGGPDAQPDAAQ